MMTDSTAIVTLTIGPSYLSKWKNLCQANWQHYADRHGYDLICLDRPLDNSERAQRRSPSWQKCLILSQDFSKHYDRIVWIDADVIIQPDAPAITAGVPIDQVGAVDEYSSPSPELYRQALSVLYETWQSQGRAFYRNETPQQYYANSDLPGAFDRVVQAGVLVLSPRYHRSILEHVYSTYEQKSGPSSMYEMRALSYELLKADRVHWLDARFNMLWPCYKALYDPGLLRETTRDRIIAGAVRALNTCYFLHFASSAREMNVANLNLNYRSAATQQPSPIAHSPATRPLNTAVALILFNRPDTTRRVFEAIRQARPRQLLLIADGPRVDQQADADNCAAARSIVERVDWDCEVLKNYSAVNLGLKRRVDSGLNWVFNQVEEAIILEDDCLPQPTFFLFCEELLARYRDDRRVLSISGNNFSPWLSPPAESYSFSRYALIWGWATWRRAWQLYDGELQAWPQAYADRWLESVFDNRQAIRYWSYIFQTNAETLDTWDYAWLFSCWRHQGLCILPNVNLVSNIGFGLGATHTQHDHSLFADLPTEPMRFPLRPPETLTRNIQLDDFLEASMFSGTFERLFKALHHHLKAGTRS